jgi:hypothetical protein
VAVDIQIGLKLKKKKAVTARANSNWMPLQHSAVAGTECLVHRLWHSWRMCVRAERVGPLANSTSQYSASHNNISNGALLSLHISFTMPQCHESCTSHSSH